MRTENGKGHLYTSSIHLNTIIWTLLHTSTSCIPTLSPRSTSSEVLFSLLFPHVPQIVNSWHSHGKGLPSWFLDHACRIVQRTELNWFCCELWVALLHQYTLLLLCHNPLHTPSRTSLTFLHILSGFQHPHCIHQWISILQQCFARLLFRTRFKQLTIFLMCLEKNHPNSFPTQITHDIPFDMDSHNSSKTHRWYKLI